MLITIPRLRSLLFSPASDARKMERALASGADAVIFDLEDGLRPEELPRARVATTEAIAGADDGAQVFVRVNAIDSGHARDDVLAVVRDGLTGVVLPKVRAPQDLRDLDVLLREAEMAAGIRPGTVVVLPIIETAVAALRVEQIAVAIDRIAGLAIGGEDYTAELGVERTAQGAELAHLRGAVAQVCAAYHLLAIDAPWVDFRDADGMRRDAAVARSIGMKGKLAIHPDQVPAIHEVFAPTERELAQARRIIEAFEAAGGAGVVSVDGRMVDAPVATRARALIAEADLNTRANRRA